MLSTILDKVNKNKLIQYLKNQKSKMFAFKTTMILAFVASIIAIPVKLLGGCSGTQYGCCYDNITICEEHCLNCPEVFDMNMTDSVDFNNTNHTNQSIKLLGGCMGTEYGCCNDNITICEEHCLNCPEVLNVSFSVNFNQSNQSIKLLGGCLGTEYGCCNDNITICEEHCLNCPIKIKI